MMMARIFQPASQLETLQQPTIAGGQTMPILGLFHRKGKPYM